MSRNASGIYTLPAGNPVVTLTTIASAWANSTLSDIGAEITNSIDKAGRTAPTANLPMATFKHTGAGAPTSSGEYLVWGQAGNLTALTLTSIKLFPGALVASEVLGVAVTPTFQVGGSAVSSSSGLFLRTANDTLGPAVQVGKSRGVPPAFTILQNNDILGHLEWVGTDGVGLQEAARITGLVNGTPIVGSVPGLLTFATTAEGDATPTDRVTIESGGTVELFNPGSLLITRTDPGTGLSIAGDVGGELISMMENTNNTAGAGVLFSMSVGGTSADDAGIYFAVFGGSDWKLGLANSDDDAFVISSGSVLGTNNRLRISTVGNVTIFAPTAGVGVTLTGFAGSDALVANGGTSGSFRINTTGVPYGTSLHNNAGAVTGAVNQYVCSGNYTPTLANSANTSAQTSAIAYWTRVGNVVTVGFFFRADPIAADTFTAITMSLPPTQSANFASVGQARGSFSTTDSGLPGAVSSAGYVDSIAATQTVLCGFTSGTDVTNRTFTGTFVYLVV
jgi:hypothetical protein